VPPEPEPAAPEPPPAPAPIEPPSEPARPAAERAAPSPLPADRPPPWEDTTPVDVNTAGIDELVRLPGIGRGAARRMIAEREANGPFRSIADLERVEGFDAGRLSRLAGRATV
jgi:competence protein ComEA